MTRGDQLVGFEKGEPWLLFAVVLSRFYPLLVIEKFNHSKLFALNSNFIHINPFLYRIHSCFAMCICFPSSQCSFIEPRVQLSTFTDGCDLTSIYPPLGVEVPQME